MLSYAYYGKCHKCVDIAHRRVEHIMYVAECLPAEAQVSSKEHATLCMRTDVHHTLLGMIMQ